MVEVNEWLSIISFPLIVRWPDVPFDGWSLWDSFPNRRFSLGYRSANWTGDHPDPMRHASTMHKIGNSMCSWTLLGSHDWNRRRSVDSMSNWSSQSRIVLWLEYRAMDIPLRRTTIRLYTCNEKYTYEYFYMPLLLIKS